MNQAKRFSIRRPLQLIVLGLMALFLLACIAVLGFRAFVMLPVTDYYLASDRAFEIPGLEDGAVPQGFCHDAANACFLMSGYSNDGEASRIYVIDAESGELRHSVALKKENGKAFKGHVGGVAVFGDYLYVAGGGDGCIYVFDYATVISGTESATVIGTVPLSLGAEDEISASFVFTDGTRLIVGEFYRADGYDTPESHHVTTKNGDLNRALALEFTLSADCELGIAPNPTCAYSLPDQVQGVCVDGDKIYLSTSWGLSFSYIYEHDMTKLSDEGTITLQGNELPLFALDSGSLTETYQLPPMAEEIAMLDGRLFVVGESASEKYIFGKFTEGKWCYSTDLSEMKDD